METIFESLPFYDYDRDQDQDFEHLISVDPLFAFSSLSTSNHNLKKEKSDFLLPEESQFLEIESELEDLELDTLTGMNNAFNYFSQLNQDTTEQQQEQEQEEVQQEEDYFNESQAHDTDLAKLELEPALVSLEQRSTLPLQKPGRDMNLELDFGNGNGPEFGEMEDFLFSNHFSFDTKQNHQFGGYSQFTQMGQFNHQQHNGVQNLQEAYPMLNFASVANVSAFGGFGMVQNLHTLGQMSLAQSAASRFLDDALEEQHTFSKSSVQQQQNDNDSLSGSSYSTSQGSNDTRKRRRGTTTSGATASSSGRVSKKAKKLEMASSTPEFMVAELHKAKGTGEFTTNELIITLFFAYKYFGESNTYSKVRSCMGFTRSRASIRRKIEKIVAQEIGMNGGLLLSQDVRIRCREVVLRKFWGLVNELLFGAGFDEEEQSFAMRMKELALNEGFSEIIAAELPDNNS